MSILLPTSDDTLELITTSAADLDVTCGFWEPEAGQSDNELTKVSSATTTTIVGAPSTGRTREIRSITICNTHASLANVITINRRTTGAVLFRQHAVTLAAGDELYYDGANWNHYVAVNVTLVPGSLTVRRLDAQVNNAGVALVNVAGLNLTLDPGSYRYEFAIRYQSTVLTTGVRFAANFSGTAVDHVWQWRWVDTSATASTAAADQDAIGAAGQVMGAFASRASSILTRGTTISVDAINANMLMILEGTIEVTVAGDLELWHGSETAVQTSVMAGSGVWAIKLG